MENPEFAMLGRRVVRTILFIALCIVSLIVLAQYLGHLIPEMAQYANMTTVILFGCLPIVMVTSVAGGLLISRKAREEEIHLERR
jgi:hypothetical protein